MNTADYISCQEEAFLKTYRPFPIVIDHGKGVYLYDTDGKKYLDFAAGYAVSALGYGNEELNETLKAQIDKIFHTSNLYYNTEAGRAADAIKRISGLDRVFFTNSGGEAVEGALKTARKYAFAKQNGRYEFIAMKESFHGRSFGALSVTGHDAYREPFEPLLAGVSFAEFNNLESVKALVTDKTCAVILEPIQGEGGVHVATKEFLQGIRELCNDNDMLMICDEVQCGMGRSGAMFAWQDAEIVPDILTMAKAVGSGIPAGAFAMTEVVAEASMKPGDHGTTYGGNPLAAASITKTIEIFEREHLAAHAKEMGQYLEQKLDELIECCDAAVSRRGKGLMQALAVKRPVAEVTANALKEGLLVIGAGADAIRFIPPLVIEKEHIDEMTDKLFRALTA